MSFDIYGDRAVEAIALIREFARVEYWDYFKGDPERALEAFCVMQDAAEAKSAARIAELEAQVSALKAAGGVPKWISVEDRRPEDGDCVLVLIYPYNNKENSQLVVESNYHDGTFMDHEAELELHEPTHWMPLPAAPQAAEQTKQQEPK